MAVNLRQQRLEQAEANRAALGNAPKLKVTGVTGTGFLKRTFTNKQEVDAYNKKAKELDLRVNAEKTVLDNENALQADLQAADSMVSTVLGSEGNLGRIRDDASVQQARDAYARSTDLSLVRDSATAGLQAAEASSNRQLAARLAQSGVKGGLAGGAFTDVANMNLRNRAALESNLAQQNVIANQQRAQFETQLAQFDLGQQNAEQNLRLQTKIGLTQQSQLARSGFKQEEQAKNIGTMSGGK